jgi:hypothetical protein
MVKTLAGGDVALTAASVTESMAGAFGPDFGGPATNGAEKIRAW